MTAYTVQGHEFEPLAVTSKSCKWCGATKNAVWHEKQFRKANRNEPHVPNPTCMRSNCQGGHLRRVEFVEASGEFLGNDETYFVSANYATHSALWQITKTDVIGNNVPEHLKKVYEKNGVQDREGNWWLVWCALFSMKESVTKAIADELAFRDLPEYFGQVWIGEL